MAHQDNTAKAAVFQLEAPRFEHGKPMLIAGLRGHFTTANWAAIPAQWERLVSYGAIPGQLGSVHYGLCFVMSNGIDYLCGVEVSNTTGLPLDFTSVRVPAEEYVVFRHPGHVSKLRDTLDAIWHQWFAESGYEVVQPSGGAPNFFERYGEKFDPRTGMGDIEVWIPVKTKRRTG